jgi:hypothetical protein
VDTGVRITDAKLHVLARETGALVTSFDGLREDGGPAGRASRP